MFGHVQHEKDADKYQGSEFHKLIFDEAVQFTASKLTKIKGANRKKINDPLPLSIWYTGNPGGVSHDYFNEQFINGPGYFINYKYTDNPYLIMLHMVKYLCKSKIATLYYIVSGSLEIGKQSHKENYSKENGLQTDLFEFINETIIKWLRMWDLAATKKKIQLKKVVLIGLPVAYLPWRIRKSISYRYPKIPRR